MYGPTRVFKNRFFGYNIRLIQDIIDYTENLNIEGAVLFLDFKTAFDSVSWSFMFAVLEKFGFNKSFIDWVKVIYKNISACIINDSWKSIFLAFREEFVKAVHCLLFFLSLLQKFWQ